VIVAPIIAPMEKKNAITTPSAVMNMLGALRLLRVVLGLAHHVEAELRGWTRRRP
jgi:hypothetical protein